MPAVLLPETPGMVKTGGQPVEKRGAQIRQPHSRNPNEEGVASTGDGNGLNFVPPPPPPAFTNTWSNIDPISGMGTGQAGYQSAVARAFGSERTSDGRPAGYSNAPFGANNDQFRPAEAAPVYSQPRTPAVDSTLYRFSQGRKTF